MKDDCDNLESRMGPRKGIQELLRSGEALKRKEGLPGFPAMSAASQWTESYSSISIRVGIDPKNRAFHQKPELLASKWQA
ncbi:hypothetical protein RRG08_005722 [Elysia crispata]|uniref:Uncharacterized protein n=1 Tax=Elysia crispata TaxID=231223 RepID=A0AAE1CWK4_9GAST|nr:hypothetical protein RRG08_005722 [Elysia crispata]